MSEIDTSTEAVGVLAKTCCETGANHATLIEAPRVMLALAAERDRLREHLGICLSIIDATIKEGDRTIEWGEEDPIKMGEWFDDYMAQIDAARAALKEQDQ